MIWAFLYHMKMVSARLKMPTLKVQITTSVMTMALMRMKHGCMGIGFIRLVNVPTRQSYTMDNHTALQEGALKRSACPRGPTSI